MRFRRGAAMVAVALVSAFVVWQGLQPTSRGSTQSSLGPTKWVFNVNAVEYKGSTEVAKEPFPTQPAPAGGGYLLKPPVDGKWETSAYRWAPDVITVFQGDEVELRFWGVNGGEHFSLIEGYVPQFTVKRGELTTVSFKADRAGVFKMECANHRPSMEGHLVVLPRG